MQIDLVSEIEEYYELINNNSCTFYQSPKHLKFLEQILQSSLNTSLYEKRKSTK